MEVLSRLGNLQVNAGNLQIITASFQTFCKQCPCFEQEDQVKGKALCFPTVLL